jgi:hypothetical protein
LNRLADFKYRSVRNRFGKLQLQLLDFFFDFLCTFSVKFLFIRGKLAEEPEKLTCVNAFFVGDVLQDFGGELVVR